MAAKEAASRGVDFSQIIHHSDRGVQYCCNLYVNRLLALNIQISMTEDYKPTDNVRAERINGIIKPLFLEGQRFTEISEVHYALVRGIPFYNDVRPHSSLGYETPSRVHDGIVKEPKQLWKTGLKQPFQGKTDIQNVNPCLTFFNMGGGDNCEM